MPAAVDKSGEKVRAMFAAIAPRYDLLNRTLSLRIDQRWRRRTVAATLPRVPPTARILDVCTGTGDLALMYKQRLPAADVRGVDFCAPMLDRARRKAADAKLDVPFAEADALALPFGDAEFDLVTVAFGLRNVADTARGVAELARVAKPGGTVAVLEFSTPHGPLLGRAYRFYFRQVLPRIGQWAMPNASAAYEYLPASVAAFPEGEALCTVLASAGLREPTFERLAGGIATLYLARR